MCGALQKPTRWEVIVMGKFNTLKKENQDILLKYQQKAIRKIVAYIIEQGWDVEDRDVYFDNAWGWIILAARQSASAGILLRRIKPFQLDDESEIGKAISLQEKLRKDLVEVFPYFIKADKNRNMKVELIKPSLRLF